MKPDKKVNIEQETAAFIKSLGLPGIDEVTSKKHKDKTQTTNQSKPGKKEKKENANKNDVKEKKLQKSIVSKQQLKAEKKAASKKPDTWIMPTTASTPNKKTPTRVIPWLVAPMDTPDCLINLPENTNWYLLGLDVSRINPADHRIDKVTLQHICDTVASIYESEQAKYNELKATNVSADQKWINNITKTGTLADKVAALAMQITKAPVYELDTLDTLIAMASKKEQRTQQLALEALKDLLLHNLLPDRRLRPMRSQPLGYADMTLETALLCHFEDLLIPRISAIVDAIEAGLRSTVEYFRRVCMEMMADWLIAKPEQEARLLSMLVNKLGDPVTQNCSKAMSLLRKVIYHHAAMKVVVVKEIRQFTMRPNLPPRATYSAILLLSQMPVLDARRDSEVAEQLIECYLGLFEKAVAMDEVGSKLLSALLSGINRVFPYLRSTEAIVRHMDVLFKIVHTGAFSTSTQSLMLISHIALQDESANKSEANQQLIDRFYRALYSKLLSEQLFTRTHNSLFLNLLFRSMKRDASIQRIMAFIKRIMICSTQCSPPIAAGLLFLISEVCKVRKELLSMITELKEIANDADDYHKIGNFDAAKLAPEFSCSAPPSMWELCLHMSHFHPSVKAFATSLASEEHIIAFDGDPTVEFSLSSFLNRFAYKNPKKKHMDKSHRPHAQEEEPINMIAGSMADSLVAPDKAFFHKYFGDREKLTEEGKVRNRQKKRNADDNSELDEDEIDAYADKLAEDLLRGGDDEGPDIDDDDDMSDDDFDKPGNDSDDHMEDTGDVDSDDDDMPMDFDDAGDFAEPGSDEDFEDEEEAPKKDKKKKRKNLNAFASAEDYEEQMDAIMAEIQGGNSSSKETRVEKAHKKSKKAPLRSNKRRKL